MEFMDKANMQFDNLQLSYTLLQEGRKTHEVCPVSRLLLK